ncbi:nuclear transport factor 2 family protein [Bradyrhizobium sp. SZCCHNPS1003]|uniref:nuclear transport factor 2 family protein n=1 Tax=Bradyrhizobium sp. SZCCHNPS1003 TaxID=3057330 RepID=UPI0028EFB4DA|nr:nuclear transport factor 2 family protein [Bradyrhizobium sp. SZCCHNPS1003]
MTEHSLWRLSRALHGAINDRRFDDFAELLDDDIDWAIYGPIDMFPFLGARHGRAAVLDAVRQIADNVSIRRLERETLMLDETSAATMVRCAMTAQDSDKPVTARLAQFMQFRAGKLARLRILIDTFDLIEQTLGRSIDLPRIGSFA